MEHLDTTIRFESFQNSAIDRKYNIFLTNIHNNVNQTDAFTHCLWWRSMARLKEKKSKYTYTHNEFATTDIPGSSNLERSLARLSSQGTNACSMMKLPYEEGRTYWTRGICYEWGRNCSLMHTYIHMTFRRPRTVWHKGVIFPQLIWSQNA